MRVVVIGDDGVGKSTFITCLFKNRFVNNIENVLPPLFFPRPNGSIVQVIDTSPKPELQSSLLSEIRHASCILLMFSDTYTAERVSLFWLPFLRTSGVNKPIILCQNKQDDLDSEYLDNSGNHGNSESSENLGNSGNSGSSGSSENVSSIDRTYLDANETDEAFEDAVQLMREYKEISCFIKTSAKTRTNINEAFYLCQSSVLYPLAPLFDASTRQLKPLTVKALSNIFFLYDEHQTGLLSRNAIQRLQKRVFETNLNDDEHNVILANLANAENGPELYVINGSITLAGFLALMCMYCEQGRHETVWSVLRRYHYTDSLSLDDAYLYPNVQVNEMSHVELSPDGYQFLVDLFTLFDKDNDGGLNQRELNDLFTPTPGLPKFWTTSGFPNSCLKNDVGNLTLQGWLAQWSMFVFLDHKTALSYLAMLGFTIKSKSSEVDLRNAIKVTKQGRKRNPNSRMYRSSVIKDRQVFNCYVLGSKGSGKSSLLASFLGVPESSSVAVNSVEMPGGKQCYLILQEVNESVLTSESAMADCDVLCLCYDSSDPDSFAYLEKLFLDARLGASTAEIHHPKQTAQSRSLLVEVPLVFAALKADLDRVQQRCMLQPEDFALKIGLSDPMHLSTAWPSSLNALFAQLVEVATHPGKGTIVPQYEDVVTPAKMALEVGVIAVTAIAIAIYALRRKP